MQLERDIVELVRETGTILLGLWPGGVSKSTLDIKTKSDGSQVTNADLMANELLVRGINRLCPSDRIVSEEGPQQLEAALSQRVWYIDPLDGTSSFIAGRDDFGVFAALEVEGRLHFSCLFFPARDECAWALKGRGAHLNGRRLQVSSREKLGNRSINLRNIDRPDCTKVRRPWIDSGKAFLSLCRGDLDGVAIRIGGHQVWDIAAPALLVEESGGRVTDEQQQPIGFDGTRIRNSYLIASNGPTHEELLSIAVNKAP